MSLAGRKARFEAPGNHPKFLLAILSAAALDASGSLVLTCPGDILNLSPCCRLQYYCAYDSDVPLWRQLHAWRGRDNRAAQA